MIGLSLATVANLRDTAGPERLRAVRVTHLRADIVRKYPLEMQSVKESKLKDGAN